MMIWQQTINTCIIMYYVSTSQYAILWFEVIKLSSMNIVSTFCCFEHIFCTNSTGKSFLTKGPGLGFDNYFCYHHFLDRGLLLKEKLLC